MVNSAILNNIDFQNAAQNFINNIFQGQPVPPITIINNQITVPDGYLLAVANVWNRGIFIPVPMDLYQPMYNMGESGSCSCTSGNCSAESHYGVSFCKGNCSGRCSLTIDNVVTDFNEFQW